MAKNWIIFISLVFLTTVSIFGQTILTVTPDSAYQGEILTIELSGQNTHFAQGSQTIWFNQASSTIYPFPASINATNNQLLTATFFIPFNSNIGLWDVNVGNYIDGLITKNDGFELVNSPYQPEIINVEPDTIYEGEELTISLSGQNTHFLQGTQTVWFNQGSSTIYANNVNCSNNSELFADFLIPCETTDGNWTLNLTNFIDGFLTYDSILIHESVVIDSVISTDLNCYESNDGAITIEAQAATDLSYFNGYVSQATGTFNNLDTGIYNIIVTNLFGCSDTSETAIISQPSELLIENFVVSDTNSFCIGMATVSVTGGTTPFSYQWNEPQNQNSDTAINLCAGTYLVTVSDLNNCIVQDTVVVDNIVGILNIKNENIFNVFPNPNIDGKFFLENKLNSEVSLKVLDILGNEVFETFSYNSLIEINIAEQKSGLYFLSILVGNEIISKKLILLK
ncbi:MAG: T9SS type A sorting domain-containing protein [Bacteroidetes bacterium]|jgi:hypothetical protein|nr:T9SS type A sorting domain-containing protein [Bacteroidota bacterium]MBT6687871.1 T9SS type A sorting domain-containing protein [Bacteroidota bacterium]MBT7142481.1 T9SS type A sorting domain-containing protein [Bacteroidota bacterium]MBT7490012.1 T9SS type A sorting domain-containing protein [Bacteroidota bacterium]